MLRRHPTTVACTATVLAAFLVTPVAWGETLTDIARLTLETNPDITEMVNERLIRNELAEEARAGHRPRVDFIGEIGWEATRSPATRGRRAAAGLNPKDFVDLTRRQMQIDGRWTVYDGQRTVADIAGRLDSADASAYLLRDAAERVTRAVAENYVSVQRDRELVELSQQNLLDHQRIHDQIRQRAESGVGRQADLDQADARLALSESNVVSSEAKLEDTRAAYARVVGDFPPEAMEPAAPVRAQLPESLPEAVRIAEYEHPLVLATEADLAASQEGIRIAESAFHPTIEGQLVARYGDDLDGIEGYDQDFMARVNVDYNLFRGFADEARVRRSEALVKQAQDSREIAIREVAEQVRLAWNQLTSAERRFATLERHVESTQRARDAYRQQFNIGERSLLDLLDSENELFEARRDLVAARADYATAIYGVLAGMGRLTADLQLTLPEQAEPMEVRARTNPDRDLSTSPTMRAE
jgi:adhesin transport system outer membrane protein